MGNFGIADGITFERNLTNNKNYPGEVFEFGPVLDAVELHPVRSATARERKVV